MTTLARLTDVSKTYAGTPPIEVLAGINMTMRDGERIAVVGRSGAGKSTLLNILGLLDRPTTGVYELLGLNASDASATQRDEWRTVNLGFIFQDHHVLGHRTVAENLSLRLAIARRARRDRAGLIANILEDVGLGHRESAPARLLSGGEKQRLAIARAIIARPRIILADEPTGNLDSANAESVLDILDAEAARGVCVVIITHDERVASWADRKLIIADGRLG